jgi:ADP-heptose:LPS heptosyltransferase
MRGGRGLGDTIYLQSIARHMTEDGVTRMRVASDYADVFLPLGRRVQVIPFTRTGVDIVAHYVGRKAIAGTSQFVDMCFQAGIRKEVGLRLDWKPIDLDLVQRIKAAGRPVVCVQLPRAPMGRVDGFGADLLPSEQSMQAIVGELGKHFAVMLVGSGRALYNLRGIDIDLANQTSVSQMIDAASQADVFFGYPSFIIPLAESLGKPGLFLWSRAGLRSPQPFIAQITPEKLLHKPGLSRHIIDNATPEQINAAVASLLQPA